MKRPTLTSVLRLRFFIVVLLFAGITYSTTLIAQDFDDSLESELDAANVDGAASDEPTKNPLKDPVQSKRTEPAIDSVVPASDEPNAKFEARLAGIYSEHSEPISEEKWTGLLGARAAESYSIQAGDTLWDLSQTLFADGFYWSKLWAENPEIQNPHQISKGQSIRFIGGTEATAPEIRVVPENGTSKDGPDLLTIQTQAAFEKEDVVPAMQEAKQEEIVAIEVKASTKFSGTPPSKALNQAPFYQEDIEGKISQADLEAGVVLEQSEIVPRPILPPPSEEHHKVLLDIPRSFPEYRPKRFERTVTVQKRNSLAEKIPAAIVPPYLGFQDVPEPLGEIVEVDNAEVASLGQSVIIEGNEPLVVGSHVHSIVPRFDIRSPINGKIGKAVELGGVLRIIERVDEGSNLYRAVVIYGVGPVRVGSSILPGDPPRVQVTTVGRRLSTELTVVGSSDSETRRFFADGATVFLDARSSGVRVGDVLAVQARIGSRKKSTTPDRGTPVGILKVFSVNGKVASAVVVVTTDDIRPGDVTGPQFPVRMPDLRSEIPRVTPASVQ